MSTALALVQRVSLGRLALPELLRPGLLVWELRALRRAFRRPAFPRATLALRACRKNPDSLVREELASPPSVWLHLPATVGLAACFPRPS